MRNGIIHRAGPTILASRPVFRAISLSSTFCAVAFRNFILTADRDIESSILGDLYLDFTRR